VTLEVLDPGLLTTVEDTGRPGSMHLGVPRGGAQDAWSLAVANALVGTPRDAAALEITLIGPRLRANSATTIALAGADLGGRIGPQRVHPGEAASLVAGDELVFDGPDSPGSGARAYVSVAGGVDVPLVLGSRSTCLAAGFGGFEGRPLRTGDRIDGRPHADRAVSFLTAGARWPGPARLLPRLDASGAVGVRIVARAPSRDGREHRDTPVQRGRDQAAAMAAARAALIQQTWRIGAASNRMGLRLASAATEVSREGSVGLDAIVLPETVSHGVAWGAVQLPPGGNPIVLLADHQPTGGYPVVAVAITADQPVLGQLAPGASVRFEVVSIDAAQRALAEQRRDWADALGRYRADRGWEELWLSAGG
jgi:antagonist of KipI